MITLELPPIENIVCLGAHCDDIEIGCGATIMRLIEQFPKAHIRWVVFSSNAERAAEARHSASLFLAKTSSSKVDVMTFRDGFFPWQGADIKERFEAMKGEISPDLIFTHYGRDCHQDHRIISELAWNTWRNHMILEYEIPKYDGDLGSPNFFVRTSEDHFRQKLSFLMQSFPSQAGKAWFCEETFAGLARIRGMESNSTTGLAEAFYLRKICV
jgi:LmbE family N-acetylglucosaminyl deacetylase